MKKNVLVLALTCCATVIISSLIISGGLSKIVHENRTVSVRGLAEKEVDADMAVWRLSFSLGDNDLISLQKGIVAKTQIVTQFLEAHGLNSEDYSVLSPEINDTTVNVYLDANRRTFDYVAKQAVLIRSTKVQSVKETAGSTLELLGKGISVSSEYDSKVSYEFNGLNAIKPEMIASATENARLAAEQFARDSHSKVGKISSASQGLFSIDDAAVGLEDKKRVRVVTTVVYTLVD